VPPQAPPAQGYAPPQQPYAAPAGDQYQAAAAQNPYATPGAAAPAAPLTAEQDKQMSMWAHLGGVISFLAFFTGWLGLLAIVPALVIYLVFKNRGRLVNQEAKEALNFQITMVGAMIIWAIVATVVTIALFFSGLYFIGLLFALIGWALVVIDVIFSIIAAMRVNGGATYRYPFAVRLIK
jgi:uncharacterized Tic20 family protein